MHATKTHTPIGFKSQQRTFLALFDSCQEPKPAIPAPEAWYYEHRQLSFGLDQVPRTIVRSIVECIASSSHEKELHPSKSSSGIARLDIGNQLRFRKENDPGLKPSALPEALL